MLPPTKLTQKVHDLEDKYATSESTSIENAPDTELQELANYAEHYFEQAERASKHHWNIYSHSPEYRAEIDRLLSRLDTCNMTMDEIVAKFDEDPILSEHGRHLHERANVSTLLAKHDLQYKRKPAPKLRLRPEKEHKS